MRTQLILAVVITTCFLSAPYSLHSQRATDADLTHKLQANRDLFPTWDHGPSLRVRAAQSSTDITLSPQLLETEEPCGNNCVEDVPKRFTKTIEHSDLVVVAIVNRNISALTKNEAFLFTLSQIQLAEDPIWVGQNSPKLAPRRGEEISVVRPGGKINLDGHVVQTSIPNQMALQAGHKYLLFLHYVPISDSYTCDEGSGFDVSDEKVIALHKSKSRTHPETSAGLLEMVKSASRGAKETLHKFCDLGLIV